MGAPLPDLLGVLIVAYLILGGKVLLTAAKNVKKGQVFDENYLMSIATLGTFAIAEYPEAVGVMLFYFETFRVLFCQNQREITTNLRLQLCNLKLSSSGNPQFSPLQAKTIAEQNGFELF